MNILIIGSKGFIGEYCAKHFSKSHQVWLCDVSVDYTSKNYTQIDSTNADYSDVLKQTVFDVCINCSGAASVPNSISHPERDFNLNTLNVFKQLEAIRKYNTNCKYINLSSAAVYGNPESLPIIENHTLSPISPYGVHKKMAEEICKEFFEVYAIKTCSLRIFSAYGNKLHKQLFWDLYSKYKEGKQVTLYGSGNESRDFIHVLDIVQAIECVIENSTFRNDIINVANGKEVIIKDAVACFYNNFETDINYNFGETQRKGDPINWVANIDKLKSLGYKQSISITEGLKMYSQWLQENE